MRGEALKWRELEGEVVAVDLRRSEYFGVNRTGSVLWQAVAEGTTRTALVALLRERYGLDEDAAAEHVERFVADLDSRGLIDTE